MAKAIDYWKLIEPIWLPLNRSWDGGPQKFLREFGRVPRELGHLYAAHWCQSEVCNGGFQQFFSNTTGLVAPEALEGFRAIGADQWAELLAEAMKRFGVRYPRDRSDRERAVRERQHPEEKSEPFRALDERFYEWADNWNDAANAYAGKVAGPRYEG
jgi:hypothetical protein